MFGSFSDHDLYQRNRTLVELFSELSADTRVIRPRRDLPHHSMAASGPGFLKRSWQTIRDALSLLSQLGCADDRDTLFVPYPAYLDILLLWLSGKLRGRRLVVDAFLDLYSTVVEDRGMLPAGSIRARMLLFMQRFTLSKASLVLIDTPEQAELMRERLRGTGTRVAAVPVGIDESLWQPLPAAPVGERCKVLFWGTFIPLHGVEHIVEAFRLLERRGMPIDLHLIGDGQTADAIAANLLEHPLSLLRWDRRLLSTAALRNALQGTHLVLGIFGASAKAASVLPYKLHQALASDRPVITRASPAVAIHEDQGAGLLTVPAADPEQLAACLENSWLRLREGWQPGTREIFERNFGRTVLREALTRALLEDGPSL
ncbi:MAG: glycosyltransferase involved in cell wall biosynthesis [Halieaceae bacterium]